jgi:uncharacterized delta-60 repeat protein
MHYNKPINVIFSKLLLTIFVTFLTFNIILAAEGDLDLTFNGNGKVITQIGDATDDAKASVIQNDGKIVVVGSSGCCGITGNNGFAVARYNVDGSLDNTFDDDGRVFTLLGIYGASANAVVIQSDGKIVVAGVSYSKSTSFAVVRYNSNGSLDTSFGTDGKVLTGIGAASEARTVVIQTDGKIIVGGNSFNSSFNQTLAVARYNSDGTLDTTFDNDGIVTGTTFDCAFSIAIQSDGKIVAQSFSNVIRYNSNGSVDSSFGNNGRVAVGQYNIYKTRSLAIQTDGKILATGYAHGGLSLFRFNTDGIADVSFAGEGSMLLQSGYLIQSNAITTQFDGKIVIAGAAANGVNVFRVNSNGSVDSSFGTNGVVTSYSDWVEIVSLIIQPDSKIVTTQSYRLDVPDRNFSVNRYNTDGSLDASFDSDGKVITGEFAGNSNLSAVAVQPDGKIVAAGYTTVSTYPYTFDFAVARYNANGTLDTSFDQDGKIRTAVGNIGFDRAYAVAVQSDGKIVVAGSTEYRNNNNLAGGFAIVRYNQDGSLDNSFDGDGKMITEIPNRYFGSASSVLIQPDGKIVAAGTTSGTTVNQTIVRYNSDGSLDNTFGNNGVFIETDWKINDIVSLAIQSDGKFVTIGTAYTLVSIGISNVGFAVARYNSNGTPDNTFGVQGKVITPFGSSGQVKSLKIQTDGKIIAGGTSLGETLNTDPSDNTKQVFTIFRYNPDGNLDSAFDGDGKVYTSFEKNANLSSMAIQADNKIVAVGNTFTPNDNALFAVARYMPNGSSDSTFDNDGKLTKGFNGKSAAIQPNGKIIVGGGMRSTFGLVRYQGTPIAANAGIGGRITTASGRGIQNVSVQISGGNLNEPKFVKTNAFGYYRFQDLQVGQNYVVGVSAKRYSFANPTRVITLNEDLTGEDFASNDK